jgi:predicted O-methyltransferase YrrM
MPSIIAKNVEAYLDGLLRPRDDVLTFLERDAEKNGVPIVGPLVGNLLAMIATSCSAKNILEIGTATGYSGIWLGSIAKQNGGKLTTIEFDPQRAKIASKSFHDAGLDGSIEIVSGDARKEVPKISKGSAGKFDLTFLDVGDKSLYVDLLEDCINVLRVGGFLVADNALWLGKVPTSTRDRETVTIREFNRKIYDDNRLLPTLLPLRDGVIVALKTKKK